MICHHCRGELKIEGYISRSDECPQCASDICCCLNCTNYDAHAHNKCREPQAEWVTDRERRNFCDYFSLNPAGRGGIRPLDRVQGARDKLNQLFKPKEPDAE